MKREIKRYVYSLFKLHASDQNLLTEKRDHVVCFFLLNFFRLQLAVENVDLQKIVAEKKKNYRVRGRKIRIK